MANVFNISPRYPFLDVLARYILETGKQSNINIANDIVLLPTRRACRRLKEIFFELKGQEATLLPKILPLGDVDEDGVSFIDYANDDLITDLPPAISNIERNLLLSYFIKKYNEQITEEQAYSLAVDLSHLMNTVEMEELNFSNLKNIVPEEFSEHWQNTLKFLTIITEEFPKILKEFNLLNPVDRNVKLIKKQIEFWKLYPPHGRIFAAGSTGSLVPISEMLVYISNLKNGFLILPGLDKNISDSDFELLTSDFPFTNQNHPQYGLLKLLKKLDIKISEIPELPLFKDYKDISSSDRELLSSKIMILPDMHDSWQNMPKLEDSVLDGVSEIRLDNEAEEVFAISCLLRKSVAENKKTILITPDRKIAKSVSSELKRWNIIVDDSAGVPASDTTTGNYIILLLKMLYNDFSPYSLLSVLKHEYTRINYDKETLNNLTEKLETKFLRENSCIDNLEKLLSLTETDSDIHNLLLSIKTITSEFYSLMQNEDKYPLYELLKKHIELVEKFVSYSDINTSEILWATDLHSSLSEELGILLNSLKAIQIDNLPIDKMTANAYFKFISNYLLSLKLRPSINTHPNIAIMNSIEARLMDADLYIMSGLNEDIFPRVNSDDPWMNRPMKAKFKLPLPERKVGLSSHDFVEFFCKKNVIMTYASKMDNTSMMTSRWLTKLSAIVDIGHIVWKDEVSKEVLSWINKDKEYKKKELCKRPSPCPPLYARPDTLSATWIEKWYRDPYIVYAGKILDLKKLFEINQEVSFREFGNIIHESLEEFKKKNLSSYDSLIDIMIRKSLPYKTIAQIDFWYSKFKVIAKWFVDYERQLKDIVNISFLEETGEYQITPTFKITAKADRIDILNDFGACIYDYKTGSVPKQKDVETYSPQLPIEAIILQNQGFKNIKIKPKYINFRYIKLDGKDKKTLPNKLNTSENDEIIKTTINNLKETISEFSKETTPYISRPNPDKTGHLIETYSEYTHLARVKEWES